MNKKDTHPNSRSNNYRAQDSGANKANAKEDYDGSSVNRGSNKMEINIMNLAHGEDDSNLEGVRSNYRSREQHLEDLDPESSNFQEEPTGTIKFKNVKDHGLVWPWHPQQVGTWITMVILVATYFVFLIPGTLFIATVYVWVAVIVYVLLLLGVILFCIRATLRDPTDRNVQYERQWRKDGIEAEENDELEYFWDVWEAYVHDRTKHCGDWNRCVDMFDHHWKWLNNWVGGKNYHDFLILISVLLAQTIVFIIVSIIFIVSAFTNADDFQKGFQDFYGTDLNEYGLVVYVIILNLLCALIVFFTSTLIWLHIKLKRWGLTAYEYIVYKDEKEERLEWYKAGEITKEQYEEQERQALEDIRKKKSSKIIHQINKENKQAYKQRIIERNKKAKALQTKNNNERAPYNNKTKTGNVTESHKEKDEFYDISKNQSPQRVENYHVNKNGNNNNKRAFKYKQQDSVKQSPSPQNIGSSTESPRKDESPAKADISEHSQLTPNSSYNSQDRQDFSSLSKESDLNDRDTKWKLNKDSSVPQQEVKQSSINRMEKRSPSGIEEHSDDE